MDRARTVGELRPKPALVLSPDSTIASAAAKMQAGNADSGLVVSPEGGLVGILTDTDVTRKVVAAGVDPTGVVVASVMTASPMCVKSSDNAVEALCLMVERRFRHLPVLDEQGAVVGVLDIAKCLYEAITRLERHLSSASSALSSAVLAALPGHQQGGGQSLVEGMVQKLFAPSLASLLESAQKARSTGGPPPPLTLGPHESVQRAAEVMAARGGAILVASETSPCAGILTPKDILFKLVGKGMAAADVTIESVMTRSPDTMPSSATVLQALHQLQ